MAYRDCLDWVGKPYSIASFAAEAETRGCCRKVSGWPRWLEPGKSRVYLAHRGRLKPAEKGVIFGYYDLAGADVVMSPITGAESLLLGEGPGGKDDLREFWEAELSTSLGSGRSDGRKRPRSRPDPYRDDLIDFIVDLLIDCSQPPLPVPGGKMVSTFQSSLEAARCCGFRPGGEVAPGDRSDADFWWSQTSAVYLVDGLTRGIDESFCELLKKLIKDAVKEAGKSLEAIKSLHRNLLAEAEGRPARSGRRRGAKVFDQALEQAVAKGGFTPTVPSGLEGHCHLQGALVLFDPPYPTYHQRPSASFRGYQRIDGDDLLNQIVANYQGQDREVELPFFVDESRPLKWSTIVALLAKRTGMGRAQARRALNALRELISEELMADKDGSHKVWISGLGTFDTRLSAATIKQNPITREPIQIPAKRRVRFRAAAPLQRKIAGPPQGRAEDEAPVENREE